MRPDIDIAETLRELAEIGAIWIAVYGVLLALAVGAVKGFEYWRGK